MATQSLDYVTRFITSPPGQLAAGSILASLVWSFFTRVENLITDDARNAIAIWVSDLEVSGRVKQWAASFVLMFDRVFGSRHLSVKCFARSAVASYAALLIALTVGLSYMRGFPADTVIEATDEQGVVIGLLAVFASVLVVSTPNIIVDYISLLKTRLLLRGLTRRHSVRMTATTIIFDLFVTMMLAAFGLYLLDYVSSWFDESFGGGPESELSASLRVLENGFDSTNTAGDYVVAALRITRLPLVLAFVLPMFVASIWLWVFAVSGVIVRLSQRVDVGVKFFARYFDLQKKPLQALGFVGGMLVAIVYWVVALTLRLVTTFPHA